MKSHLVQENNNKSNNDLGGTSHSDELTKPKTDGLMEYSAFPF